MLRTFKPNLGELPMWANPAGIPQPVGAWILNERGGGKLFDLIGNFNLDFTAGVSWGPDCIVLTGVNTYAGASGSPLMAASEFTLFTIIREDTNHTTYAGAFSTGNNAANEAAYIGTADAGGNNIGGGLWLTDLNSGVPIVTGQWYSVVLTCDGTNMLIYVDGIYKNSVGATPNIGGGATRFGQIADQVTYDWRGSIKCGYIYDKGITSAQVAYLYQHPYYAWEYPEIWEYYSAAVAGVAPTGVLYGPLVGPLGGPI